MRFRLLAGLWVGLILGLTGPLVRADPTMTSWNKLMIDQLLAGYPGFVSWVGVGLSRGLGCAGEPRGAVGWDGTG